MKALRFTRLFVLLLLTSGQLRADSPQPGARDSGANSPSTQSRDETMRAMRNAVDSAYAAYTAAAPNPNQSEKLWTEYWHLNDTNLPKIFQLAKQEPASGVACEMFEWIATNRRISVLYLWTNGLESVELLGKYHATNSSLGPVCARIGYYWDGSWRDPQVTGFLKSVAEKNPDRTVRGQAFLAQARLAKSKADAMAFVKNTPSNKLPTNAVTDLALDMTNGTSVSRIEAESLFGKVIHEYGDCPSLRNSGVRKSKPTLADEAKPELNELLHLSIGQTAPDIAGRDLDDRRLKLSDYRGKVVVLSFWASWCGPCMQAVPGEVKLAERMKGKPFALLGVNGDSTKKDALRAVEKEKIPWRSFWSEGEGPNGPIATDWNVHGWPTVYILDANGVVRLKFYGYGGNRTERLLNETVDRLISGLPDR